MRLLPLSMVLSLALMGCATRGLVGADPSQAKEVEELKRRVLELQRKAAMNEVELERLRRQVDTLEARLGGGPGARPRPAGPGAAPSNPAPADPLPREPMIEEDDLEDLPGAALPAPGARSAGADQTPEAGSAPAIPPAAQDLYDQGYTLYHQGRFLDAEAAFQRYLQAYPETELADNAQYWIGEARYARGDHRGALAAFRESITRFPDGNKLPDALLKSGQCLEALGDLDGARRTYQDVLRRFPESAAAAVAKDRARRLR